MSDRDIRSRGHPNAPAPPPAPPPEGREVHATPVARPRTSLPEPQPGPSGRAGPHQLQYRSIQAAPTSPRAATEVIHDESHFGTLARGMGKEARHSSSDEYEYYSQQEEKRPRFGPSPDHKRKSISHLDPPRSPTNSDDRSASYYSRPTLPNTSSTSYATFARSHRDEYDGRQEPQRSYANIAATPSSPRAAGPHTAQSNGQATTKSYPPIVVSTMPDWTKHFARLTTLLGCAPNARPFRSGIRFLPRTAEEFRTVQRYLVEATAADDGIQWHCYTLEADRPTKVALSGLPPSTPLEEIRGALKAKGFSPTHIKHIPARRGRPGCIFFVQLGHLSREELARLYAIDELLFMKGVSLAAWRGRAGPPQCHRCQQYGHASYNCYKKAKCLRCGEEHLARDCPRPKEEPATCANCGRDHPANDRRCPIFRKEARARGIKVPPPYPSKPGKSQPQERPAVATVDMPERPKGQSLAPPANPATERGQAPYNKPRRRRGRGRRRHKKEEEGPAASSTPQQPPKMQEHPQPRPDAPPGQAYRPPVPHQNHKTQEPQQTARTPHPVKQLRSVEAQTEPNCLNLSYFFDCPLIDVPQEVAIEAVNGALEALNQHIAGRDPAWLGILIKVTGLVRELAMYYSSESPQPQTDRPTYYPGQQYEH